MWKFLLIFFLGFFLGNIWGMFFAAVKRAKINLGGNMVTTSAKERAKQAWCQPTTNNKVMDIELAEAFAEILDEVWSKPRLGNATTGELVDEIRTRIEMDGRLEYRTIDKKIFKSIGG